MLSKFFGKRKMSEPSIPELFELRFKTYESTTKDIYKAMVPAVQGIEQFMQFDQLKKDGAELQWDDIELAVIENEQVLILIGLIFYPVGTEVKMENESIVKVTEDTAPYFRRLVRVGLPLSMTTKSKEDVVTYFEKMEKEEEQLAKDLADELGILRSELDTTPTAELDL